MFDVEALKQITTIAWFDVKIEWNVPLGLERGINRRMKSLIEPRGNTWRPRLGPSGALIRVGDVILIVDAVGRMKVQIQRRLPPPEQSQQGTHLRRISFHVIAVQIQVLGCRAPALGN